MSSSSEDDDFQELLRETVLGMENAWQFQDHKFTMLKIGSSVLEKLIQFKLDFPGNIVYYLD